MQNTQNQTTSFRSLFPKAATLCCVVMMGMPSSAEAIAQHKRKPPPINATQKGIASIYHARRDKKAPDGNLTMAHRRWPKGTHVIVTNEENRRAVCVRVSDSGPYIDGRVADLSMPAGEKIGLTMKQGIVMVALRVVDSCDPQKKPGHFMHFAPR